MQIQVKIQQQQQQQCTACSTEGVARQAQLLMSTLAVTISKLKKAIQIEIQKYTNTINTPCANTNRHCAPLKVLLCRPPSCLCLHLPHYLKNTTRNTKYSSSTRRVPVKVFLCGPSCLCLHWPPHYLKNTNANRNTK